ncbi:MAG: phosphatase PAP2 family protein, partial [Cohnella sp.]|nr:phosphatase PAP2 family protein [Cohnella sp.]
AHYRSMGKVRFIVIAAFALFVLFAMLLIGLIQDFLAQEYAQFDEVTTYIVRRVFDETWLSVMNDAAGIGSDSVIIAFIAMTGGWIAVKGKDRVLELAIFLATVLAGKGLSWLLRNLFHREGPGGELSGWTYPSEQAMMSLIVFGFSAYLLLRHFGNHAMRLAAAIVVIAICLVIGIGLVYLRSQYPSDVAAGYVFGGVWLSLNFILLEVMRTARF